MSTQQKIRIERRGEVLSRTGFSRSTLHNRIRQGLFVPPISLGERARGWVENEVTVTLEAMVAGKSESEIQALVGSLIQKRQEAVGSGSIGR